MNKQWKTREVKVGKVGVGGNNPIRIQSMTTSNTRDVAATIEQILRLADQGCEIARVTVQGMKEAEACEGIKNGLLKMGVDIPVVADIHFYPPAAMKVVDFVDKVRINPGNFLDKRAQFKVIEYDDASYEEEIIRIEEGFSPLIEKCKRLNRSMRIGTNHGSLSDRIMNRYGDTPKGMVESALEFARVCRKLDYHEIIFSMKASNPLVMIEAYRLLVKEMMELGWDYPLHLGVTEAGEGEDGRVKSAVGTGSLLLDGIGDTIRVSLTEDPWEEIDPCKRLIDFANKARMTGPLNLPQGGRRKVLIAAPLHRDGSVLLPMQAEDLLKENFFEEIGCKKPLLGIERTPASADAIVVENIPQEESYVKVIEQLQKLKIGIFTKSEWVPGALILANELKKDGLAAVVTSEQNWDSMLKHLPSVFLLAFPTSRVELSRKFATWAKSHQLEIPIILAFSYDCSPEDLVIHASAECGGLLADNIGEGICLDTKLSIEKSRMLTLQILQAARMRNFKTEFISCPGCGRTLFELQEVSRRIKARTSHLPGVKIAIMGCIVNGPGEMADADFGYVGSKPGKIDLYVGKTRVQSDIPFNEADDRLIDLIKSHNRWKEPESALINAGC